MKSVFSGYMFLSIELKIEVKEFEDNWFFFYKMGGLDFSEIYWVWGEFANTWKILRNFSKINRLIPLFPYNKQTENEGGVKKSNK